MKVTLKTVKASTLRRSQRIKYQQSTSAPSQSTSTPTSSINALPKSHKKPKTTAKHSKKQSFESELSELRQSQHTLESELANLVRKRAEENQHHDRIIRCYREQHVNLHSRIQSYTRQCIAYRDLANDMHNVIVGLKTKIREELGEEFLLEHPERLWIDNEE